MTILICTIAAALLCGLLLPLRSGVWGFIASVAALFVGQCAVNTATGFAGSSLEESLLLFNGSWAGYLGFNLQITYRAFALPVLALAVVYLFRMSRGR